MVQAGGDAAAVRSEALKRAKARRDLLWRACQSWKEDDRIGHLVGYCTQLCGGDAKAGGALAAEAIWS
jgi:hypothetical protein